MSCNCKNSNICIDTTLASCAEYKGDLGENTNLTEGCLNLEQTTQDLYEITDSIISEQDTSNLGQLCIDYPVTDGKILPKSVFETNEEEICNLKNRLEQLENANLGDLDITNLNLDFNCLTDPCGEPITTLGILLQALINEVCNQ